MIQKVSEMIRLFEGALADLDNIGQVFPNLPQKFLPHGNFTSEEAIQWVFRSPSS